MHTVFVKRIVLEKGISSNEYIRLEMLISSVTLVYTSSPAYSWNLDAIFFTRYSLLILPPNLETFKDCADSAICLNSIYLSLDEI